MKSSNPLLEPWDGPFGAPPFDRIHAEHVLPSLDEAIAAHRIEIEAVATNPAPADFANTMAELERAGEALSRVRRVFWTISSAHADAAIRAIEPEVSARLTRHAIAIGHDRRLFDRIAAVWRTREGLSAEQQRLIEKTYRDFVAGGALLNGETKARFAAIEERLGSLSVSFGQNVLAASADWTLLLTEADCEGLPDGIRAAAARRAEAIGKDRSSDHAQPWRRRRFPELFGAARSARTGLARLRGTLRRRRARQLADPHRNGRAQAGARAPAQPRELRRGEARGQHGPHPRRRDGAVGARLGTSPPACPLRERRTGSPQRPRSDRGVGLALLRRTAPSRTLCSRRRRREAAPDPRCRASRRLRMRRAALRPALSRTARHSRLARRRSRLGSVGCARRRWAALHRLYREARKAWRRVDGIGAGAGAARRARAADRLHRRQLRQARKWYLPLDRRGAHAVPRVRPRAPCAALRRHLSKPFGHRRAARLRRVPEQIHGSTGSSRSKCWPASACRQR